MFNTDEIKNDKVFYHCNKSKISPLQVIYTEARILTGSTYT